MELSFIDEAARNPGDHSAHSLARRGEQQDSPRDKYYAIQRHCTIMIKLKASAGLSCLLTAARPHRITRYCSPQGRRQHVSQLDHRKF
jgi:hypothetical protein